MLSEAGPDWTQLSASSRSVGVLHPHTPAEYLDRNEAQFELNWMQCKGCAGSTAQGRDRAGRIGWSRLAHRSGWLAISGAYRALKGGRG